MKKFADAGRLFPQDEDGRDKARVDWIDRLAFKAGAEVCLEKICNLTEDRDTLYYAANALHFLQSLYDICEAVIARHEARGQWDSFLFLHRQLMGLALEFTGLASRRPEQACSAFKAEQLRIWAHRCLSFRRTARSATATLPFFSAAIRMSARPMSGGIITGIHQLFHQFRQTGLPD